MLSLDLEIYTSKLLTNRWSIHQKFQPSKNMTQSHRKNKRTLNLFKRYQNQLINPLHLSGQDTMSMVAANMKWS